MLRWGFAGGSILLAIALGYHSQKDDIPTTPAFHEPTADMITASPIRALPLEEYAPKAILPKQPIADAGSDPEETTGGDNPWEEEGRTLARMLTAGDGCLHIENTTYVSNRIDDIYHMHGLVPALTTYTSLYSTVEQDMDWTCLQEFQKKCYDMTKPLPAPHRWQLHVDELRQRSLRPEVGSEYSTTIPSDIPGETVELLKELLHELPQKERREGIAELCADKRGLFEFPTRSVRNSAFGEDDFTSEITEFGNFDATLYCRQFFRGFPDDFREGVPWASSSDFLELSLEFARIKHLYDAWIAERNSPDTFDAENGHVLSQFAQDAAQAICDSVRMRPDISQYDFRNVFEANMKDAADFTKERPPEFDRILSDATQGIRTQLRKTCR